MKKRLAAIAALSLLATAPVGARADERSKSDRSGDQAEARESLAEATEAYRSVSRGEKGGLPGWVQEQAKCVAIFPDVVTVSLGVGGMHSDGIGFCKTSAGKWENPMFLNLAGGNIGLQAGVKSADVVMFLTGTEAANALRQGSFTVGGTLSAVAGSYDKTFQAPAAQVVAYTRTEGLFAGATIDGISVNRDEDNELAFYGQPNPSLSAALPSEKERLVSDLRGQLPERLG